MLFLYPCVRKLLISFFYCKQQDATIFYYLFLKGSTCFGRFPRPSSPDAIELIVSELIIR